MNRLRLAAIVVMLLAAAGALAQSQYGKESRINYIQKILAALKASDRNTLSNTRNYIHVIDRNTCRSAYTDLRTNCLLEAARKNCAQRRAGRKARRRCRLISDVIITNKLGEKAFIDSRTKYRIMNATKQYRQEMRRELMRRYAELVTEFSLSADLADLAAEIENYCSRSVQRRGLSWQYCVAATTWFVGTSQNRID